jgi:hypothetical protein
MQGAGEGMVSRMWGVKKQKNSTMDFIVAPPQVVADR